MAAIARDVRRWPTGRFSVPPRQRRQPRQQSANWSRACAASACTSSYDHPRQCRKHFFRSRAARSAAPGSPAWSAGCSAHLPLLRRRRRRCPGAVSIVMSNDIFRNRTHQNFPGDIGGHASAATRTACANLAGPPKSAPARAETPPASCPAGRRDQQHVFPGLRATQHVELIARGAQPRPATSGKRVPQCSGHPI